MDAGNQDKWNLERDVKEIKTTVRDIFQVLHGESSRSEPNGLIHYVEKNTTFRKIATAWLWLLTSAVTTAFVYAMFTSAFN